MKSRFILALIVLDYCHALMSVTGLYRYAVKGLSGDALDHVNLDGNAFPDDRKFALLQTKNKDEWVGDNWLHKENFVCAFTDPQLLATLESSYKVIAQNNKRILQIKQRFTGKVLLPDTDLATESGRQELSDFISKFSSKDVICVTGGDQHQFGNTSSGVKNNKGDTRTIHIVNANTVRALSEACNIPLDPVRFRPNIVIDNAPAWCEFDEWMSDGNNAVLETSNGVRLRVISKTVRCAGVSVDPINDPTLTEIDLPKLLVEHFPQYGPYLGVYAILENPGTVSIGDSISVACETLNK